MTRLALPALLFITTTAAAQPPQPLYTGAPTFDGADFTPDSKTVLVRFLTISSSGNTRHASLYDAATGKRLAGPFFTARQHEWVAEAIHPGGTSLLISRPAEGAKERDARELVLWDWRTKREARVFDAPATCLDRAAFTPDGRLVVSTHRDGRVLTWDVEKGKQTGSLGAAEPFVLRPNGPTVVLAADSRTAVVSGPDGLAAWDLASGRKVESWAGVPERLARGELAGCSPEGRFAVTVTMSSDPDDAGPRVWDLKAGRLVRRLALPEAYAAAAWVGEDGRALGASGLGALRGWDGEGKRLWHSSVVKRKSIGKAAFSPDGKLLLTSGEKTTLQMWGTEKRKALWSADEGRTPP